MYARETLFVASERTPCKQSKVYFCHDVVTSLVPAKVRLPLRVKLVFNA